MRDQIKLEDSNPAKTSKVPVIAIVGPTGTGKTRLAIELAQKLNGEIISGDSMQVYRKMDIGTAKATPQEQKAAVHYLIDIQEYDQPYNVKIFQEKCRQSIEDIVNRNKVPIICGGTGLYIKAALYDYEFTDEQEDPELKARFESLTNEALVSFLKNNDPQSLEKIHPNNRKRLIRACMMACSGEKKTERENKQNHEPIYDVFFIGLKADKKIVDERIEKRVDLMFEQGLVREVENLFSDPESWEFTSFQGIGYKEFKDWFTKEKTLEEIRQAIIVHSRQYAKRQMTWFRNQMNVYWYDLNSLDQAIVAAGDFIHQRRDLFE
ncbi:tRNA (adenosine(37)-N6)-dimethylallyltransferase MiaA [Ileibacterium valens]|uniref:tRNA (adenosine(37)-N6)-dimethylallyltransferase MiaA n=1 Tax=Ileibacterium valens TaxID=1862668 RepID=UPI002356E4D3|nr:tRNA (adenosine(37)-N6)-dimethylallyltransferase MiaA [Ileibacterium valens]